MRLLRNHVQGVRNLLAAVLVALLLTTAQAAPLSSQDRSKVFEQVWRLIRDRYYDPNFHGLDWNGIHERYRHRVNKVDSDDALYLLMKQMTGELRDAHTRFHTPSERQRASRRVATTTGVLIANVDGEPTVVDVEPNSEADRSGVQPGMLLASVDGESASKRLTEIEEQSGTSSSQRATALLGYYRLLAGEPGSLVRLRFVKADGSPLDVVLKRHVVSLAPSVTARTLPSGIVYIRLPLFDGPVAKQANAALQKNGQAAGLILDVRGNPGGNFAGVLKTANSFFSRRVSFGHVITRSGTAPSFVLRMFGVPSDLQTGHPGKQIYAGPVVVLTNEGSGSGAELFAAGMQENGRAKVVGRQSCGCVLGTVAHKVKGGGEVDISEFAIVTSKDKRLEGIGVMPDVVVPLRLADLRQHRDAALEEAEKVLQAEARTK